MSKSPAIGPHLQHEFCIGFRSHLDSVRHRHQVNKSAIGSLIFKLAYAIKRRRYLAGYGSWLLDKIIFGKVHSVLGGKLRLMMSGGAPLSGETQEFMNIVFCVPIGQVRCPNRSSN